MKHTLFLEKFKKELKTLKELDLDTKVMVLNEMKKEMRKYSPFKKDIVSDLLKIALISSSENFLRKGKGIILSQIPLKEKKLLRIEQNVSYISFF